MIVNLFMSSSLPLDLELENFGWSENLITSNSLESFNSIVDKTMSISFFLIIYIYCLIELLLELIINDLRINMLIPRKNQFSLGNFFVSPRLTTK